MINFLIRKVELYQLKQMWSMSFGTNTGNMVTSRGAKVTLDDGYYIIPFDPSSNSDYRPVPTNSYVGIMSIQNDVGLAFWVNVYMPTT